MTILYIILGCFIYWVLQKVLDKIRRLPPGPFRFPLIGCVPQIVWHHKTLPFIAFQKLAEYYGPIVYLQMGVTTAIAINGYEANKDIFTNDDFLGRSQEKWQLDRTFGKPIGLIAADIDHWRETRRFCSKLLREFGFGVKRQMEVSIGEQVSEFCNTIKEQIKDTKSVFRNRRFFHEPVLNATWVMILGKPFKKGDPKLAELLNVLEEFFKSCSLAAGPLLAYPFLVDYAPKLVNFDKQRQVNAKFHKYFYDLIHQIRSSEEYQETSNSFIEEFLHAIDQTQKKDPGNTIYTDENLISVLYDLFVGSSETNTNTLEFGILYLLRYPNIQEKVVEEIYNVIGKERPATMEDKAKMPYTEATMLEIYRYSCVVPIGPRGLQKDVFYKGYKIPKGTLIFPNYWSICYDTSIWSDPYNFRPERFLDNKGNLINSDKIMPFALGKRNCIGEGVAKTTFFLMLTGLLQQFRFEPSQDQPLPSMEPDLGISLTPKPFSFRITIRD